VRLGGFCGQSSLEPFSNLPPVVTPLGGVGSPIAVGGGGLGDLQALDNLSQVNTLLGSVGRPGIGDSLAPGKPLVTGGLGGGEGREGGTFLGVDRFASNLGVVVDLPLSSVFLPGFGCKGRSNC
jgi:hypothetical protein